MRWGVFRGGVEGHREGRGGLRRERMSGTSGRAVQDGSIRRTGSGVRGSADAFAGSDDERRATRPQQRDHCSVQTRIVPSAPAETRTASRSVDASAFVIETATSSTPSAPWTRCACRSCRHWTTTAGPSSSPSLAPISRDQRRKDVSCEPVTNRSALRKALEVIPS